MTQASKGVRLHRAVTAATTDYALNQDRSIDNLLLNKMSAAMTDLNSYILWLERRVPAAYQEYTT